MKVLAHESLTGITPDKDELLIDKGNNTVVVGDGQTNGGKPMAKADMSNINGFFRKATADYRRFFHIPMESIDPGASGATFVPPDANTVGGWQLDVASEVLYFDGDVHDDWDGESDMFVVIDFEVNIDNSGGTVNDTVDLKLVAYYKGDGDVATRTQTVEVATVVGASARYKRFSAMFTLDWDKASNVIEKGDDMHFILNLETDTSEVDNIILCAGSGTFFYSTTHAGIEDGDV